MSTFFEWIIELFRDTKFWVTVDPWEKAVRVRLGKHTKILLPGFHWKVPILDEIHTFNTKLRLGPSSTQTISAKDGQVVTIGVQLGFSITDPLLALTSYLHPENSLAVLVHNHVAEYIMEHTVEEVDIPELEVFVLSGLKDTGPNDGITIEFIKVTSFIVSSPAFTLRLVNNDVVYDYSSDVQDRTVYHAGVNQW